MKHRDIEKVIYREITHEQNGLTPEQKITNLMVCVLLLASELRDITKELERLKSKE